MRTLEEVLKSHHYHTPSAETQGKITGIRMACKDLAELIFLTCPQHPDTTLALRDLESARMRAISCLAFYSLGSVMIQDIDLSSGISGAVENFKSYEAPLNESVCIKGTSCCKSEAAQEAILDSFPDNPGGVLGDETDFTKESMTR